MKEIRYPVSSSQLRSSACWDFPAKKPIDPDQNELKLFLNVISSVFAAEKE